MAADEKAVVVESSELGDLKSFGVDGVENIFECSALYTSCVVEISHCFLVEETQRTVVISN